MRIYEIAVSPVQLKVNFEPVLSLIAKNADEARSIAKELGVDFFKSDGSHQYVLVRGK